MNNSKVTNTRNKSMGSVNLIVIVESIRTLVSENTELRKFHLPSIIAVAAALGTTATVYKACRESDQLSGVKFLLFLYSSSLRSKSSQVHILWEDHRNDLFINGFGVLLYLKFGCWNCINQGCRFAHVGWGKQATMVSVFLLIDCITLD
jgi:hypothetical protein